MKNEALELSDAMINSSVIHTIIVMFRTVFGAEQASVVPSQDTATYEKLYAGHIYHANAVRARDSDG